MQVIAGLRNPGDKYAGTRHNVGGEVVDVLARRWDITLGRAPSRVRAMIGAGRIGAHRVVLALPNTFMNESGGPVGEVLAYHRVDATDFIVVHDDIDLDFGRLRVAYERGPGGHNGIRSIRNVLGTDGFWRLKVGVGRPPERMDPAAYVLSRFAKAERPEVDLLVDDAADVVERWLDDREAAREMAALRGK